MQWTTIECEAIVRDYFQMFTDELLAQPYSKAEHRRALQNLLNNRSDGSIEYKHQNISAVLLDFGYPYIKGYKPAFNYQKLLKDVVVGHLTQHTDSIEKQVDELSTQGIVENGEFDWSNIIDEAPELINKPSPDKIREFRAAKYNYAEREKRNRKLGELGEKFILDYEKYRLDQVGRGDLAKEVEWVSSTRGDGLGYDIRSFNEMRDEEKFIEVKTTNSGKYQPFIITDNEVAFSLIQADRYALYRVFDYRGDPRFFTLLGNINQHVNLEAKTYRASF